MTAIIRCALRDAPFLPFSLTLLPTHSYLLIHALVFFHALPFSPSQMRSELLARNSSMFGQHRLSQDGGYDRDLRLTSRLGGADPLVQGSSYGSGYGSGYATNGVRYVPPRPRGAAAVAQARHGQTMDFFAPLSAAYPEDVLCPAARRSPRTVGASIGLTASATLPSLVRRGGSPRRVPHPLSPAPIRLMSQATRDKTREQLERARFASQAEDERARTMREVMNGPARQERIKRQNHQELEDRNARYLDRKASFYEEQHRAKNAWDAESAMESARGQMIGALRTEAVRPVLSGRAAAAAAVVVGEPAHPWEQQHQPPHRQQSSATANQRSYMYDDELASGSELPPVRRSGGPLSTPGGTNHGAHQPLDAWGSPGTEMGSASHGSGTHHPATDGCALRQPDVGTPLPCITALHTAAAPAPSSTMSSTAAAFPLVFPCPPSLLMFLPTSLHDQRPARSYQLPRHAPHLSEDTSRRGQAAERSRPAAPQHTRAPH